MTAELLETLNRRTVVAAVRAQAARAGLDADALLDSHAFYATATALDPDAPDFTRRLSELMTAPGSPAAQSAPVAPAQESGPRQWTDADIAKASPQQITDAINAGLLRDLGYGPRRRRH